MMDIRICESFRGFFVERQDHRGDWHFWLPKSGMHDYRSGIEALHAAREERDLEINRACEKMKIGERLVIEI